MRSSPWNRISQLHRPRLELLLRLGLCLGQRGRRIRDWAKGVVYTFSIWTSRKLELLFSSMWLCFLPFVVLLAPFGRKRAICDHHRPSLWNGLRRCIGVPQMCRGDCVISSHYGWDALFDDLAWSVYAFELMAWTYAFCAVVYVIVLFMWSVILWLSVMLILAAGMLVTVGACCADMCSSCASGCSGECAGGCDSCCCDCCLVTSYHHQPVEADVFYFSGTFPTDHYWATGGFSRNSDGGDCCCNCRAICFPLAWLFYVFPALPENAWGGLVGYFIMGTHQHTPVERMYSGGNRFIEFMRMGWRRHSDLHHDEDWRARVYDFLAGPGEQTPAAPATLEVPNRPQDEQARLLNEFLEDGKQVLRIGLARAVIPGRHFDKFHDRCVQSSYEDYAENSCWICREQREEWDLWLSCHHIFCSSCSSQMLIRRMPCPLCRVASSTVLRGLALPRRSVTVPAVPPEPEVTIRPSGSNGLRLPIPAVATRAVSKGASSAQPVQRRDDIAAAADAAARMLEMPLLPPSAEGAERPKAPPLRSATAVDRPKAPALPFLAPITAPPPPLRNVPAEPVENSQLPKQVALLPTTIMSAPPLDARLVSLPFEGDAGDAAPGILERDQAAAQQSLQEAGDLQAVPESAPSLRYRAMPGQRRIVGFSTSTAGAAYFACRHVQAPRLEIKLRDDFSSSADSEAAKACLPEWKSGDLQTLWKSAPDCKDGATSVQRLEYASRAGQPKVLSGFRRIHGFDTSTAGLLILRSARTAHDAVRAVAAASCCSEVLDRPRADWFQSLFRAATVSQEEAPTTSVPIRGPRAAAVGCAHRDKILVSAIAEEMRPRLAEFRPQGLATTVYALGILNVAPSAMLRAVGRYVPARLHEFCEQEVTNTIYGMALLRWRQPSFLAACCQHVQERLPDATPRGMSCVVYSLALLEFHQDEFYSRVCEQFQHKLAASVAQDISNAVYGLALLGTVQSGFLAAVAAEMPRRLEEFTGQGLSNVLYGYSVLDQRYPSLLRALTSHLPSRFDDLTEQNISNIVWALGNQNFVDGGSNRIFLFGNEEGLVGFAPNWEFCVSRGLLDG
ncbi:TBC2 [Symbiodinium microadriaticum]|nr:TBC2 [Symbiodinium microadriaticum]